MTVADAVKDLDREKLVQLLAEVVERTGEAGRAVFQAAIRAEPPATSGEAPSPTPAGNGAEGKKPKVSKLDKQKAKFDMSKFHQRHIALQIQYDGTAYYGFASQDLQDTVENHLFQALEKLNLISDRKTCSYSRCGRTDKGVSALRQVVALRMRSAMPLSLSTDQFPTHPDDVVLLPAPSKPSASAAEGDAASSQPKIKQAKEMDYCTMLNNHLPSTIRILAWAPVTEDFSARFSASYRQYRYFFLKKQLDIEAMRCAAQLLLGEHDFRNLCKMDIANVTNFRREIFSAEILFVRRGSAENQEEDVYMLEIRGIAFLWHMVRCIMAVLFLVGQGLESPQVVLQLLDVETYPAKPGYALAADAPLVLHDCGFDNLRFSSQVKTLWQLTGHYQQMHDDQVLAATRTWNVWQYLQERCVRRREVEAYITYLRACHQRAANKTVAIPAPPPIADEGGEEAAVGSKRKWAESSPAKVVETSPSDGEETEEITWKEALELIRKETGHVPSTLSPANIYVPLLERNREEAYEEKVQKLVGTKKERFERHVALSAAAKETTPLFFQKMRQQGSL